MVKVIMPYLLLILILIVGKFTLGTKGVSVPIIVKHTFLFFNPGFAFILAAAIVLITFNVKRDIFVDSAKLAIKKSMEPFLVIVFMSSMVQIMVNSAQNYSSMVSMIVVLVDSVKNNLLPFWSPIVGAMGSFLTGSVTISNLMFGNFLSTAARELNFNTDSILALAVVGGAIGNMIALADILVAEAVVGIKHKERSVVKGVIIPCVILLLLVGLIGMFIF
jgi:lactate permease